MKRKGKKFQKKSSSSLNKLSLFQRSESKFLKFLGFSTAAASLAACEAPIQKVIPFVVKPEETIAGKANWYASSFYDGNDFASLLIKNREGRPIFLKTNDLCDKGGINARVQASVLNLYDSARLKTPLANGEEVSWTSVDASIVKGLKSAKAKNKQVVSPSILGFVANIISMPSSIFLYKLSRFKSSGPIPSSGDKMPPRT